MNDKRKRAVPTIDLTATEVPAPPADNGAQTVAESALSQAEQSAAQPQSDTPPPPPPEEPPKDSSGPPRRSGGGLVMAAIAAGIAGTILASGVLAAFWYGGLFPARTVTSTDQSAQIAALQKQLQVLQARPLALPDNHALDPLRQRLSKLENDIAQLPPGDKTVAERLAAADNAMKSLGIALAALSKRSDDVAAKASQAQESAAGNEKTLNELRDRVQSAKQAASTIESGALDELHKRIAALEQSLADARRQITETTVNEKAVRLALSAAALHDAVERGAPYETELAQAKTLGADEKVLAPLDQFAARGLPKNTELARQLAELIPLMMRAIGNEPAAGGFLGRLQANAGKLVRIQPVDAPAGDNPFDALARIDVDAAHADIDAALSDIGTLPDAARQKAADWVSMAQARQKALAAARQVAADTARGLNKP